MKFLVDAQLPPALAGWLQEAGHDAQHVEEVGLRSATDDAIWAFALQNGCVLVTKDEDFAARSLRDAPAPAVVWVRIGNSTNAALRVWMDPRLPGLVQMLEHGNRLVEVL